MSTVNELLGIINEINLNCTLSNKEIEPLKIWAYQNKSLAVKNAKFELIELIDKFLTNKIIKTSDYYDIKKICEELLNNSSLSNIPKFDERLSYLKSKIRDGKNIGIDLISFLDNDEAIDFIHKKAEYELKLRLSFNNVIDKDIVFISLVLISMFYYDGSFYDHVRLIYDDLYNRYSEQKIEGLIRTILSNYKSKNEVEILKPRIINVALSNAIVPSFYLKSFFEFIFDIYKLNFEYTLSDDLFEDFKFIYEGLRFNMLSEDEELQINITKKSYKLIKPTKELIGSDKDIDSIINLSIMIIELIDKQVWGKEINISNPYLKRGYDDWLQTLKKSDRDTGHVREISELRSRWEPKYLLTENSIYIVPPIHRIKAKYNYKFIKIMVENGDELLYENNDLDIREIIGGFQVSLSRLKINKPLGKIRYKLLCGEEVIYDSKYKLYRKYLVFDENGEEIKNNTDYSGVVTFCLVKEVGNLKAYVVTSEFILGFLNVKRGESIEIEDTVFNFLSLDKPGVFGDKLENYFISSNTIEDKFSVFKEVRHLVFECNKTITKFEIFINKQLKKIEEFEFSVVNREGIDKYILNLVDIEDGIYNIEVFSVDNGKRNRILTINFALDKHINVEVVKINSESYLVSVESGLFSHNFVEEIIVKEFNSDFVVFQYEEREYIYHIPFNLDIYRINSKSWESIEQGVLIGDINQESKLELYGAFFDEIQLRSDKGEILMETLSLKNNGIASELRVGFLASYKVSFDYTVLWLMKDGKVKNMLNCYNKCILDEIKTEVNYDYEKKCLNVNPMFFGDGRVYFTITNSASEEVFKSSYVDKGILESVYELNPFEKYIITFYEKEKGLSLKKDRVLKTVHEIFYTMDSFIGRSFKIKEVQFDQDVKGEFLRKNYRLHTTYLNFVEKISDDKFIGELYVKTYNNTFMLNRVNPVEIEICSDNIDGVIELCITKDGDGLLLDFEHKGIMNNLDDNFATDIFSYSMDINEVKYCE